MESTVLGSTPNDVILMKGKMSIKLIEAQLKRDKEIIGKMDPFVRISYINKEFKTQTHSDGGKQPKWNEAFDIEL